MPEHIRNSIRISGDAAEIRKLGKLVYGQQLFDFNKIVPMPKELETKSNSMVFKGLNAVQDCLQSHPEFNSDPAAIPEEIEKEYCISADIDKETWETGKRSVSNLAKYGTAIWYEWNSKHWGTPRNAYNTAETANPGRYDFNTAWAPPFPVLQKLSEMFPTLTIALCWADEVIGKNCGAISYCDGKVIEEEVPENPELFACTIWGLDYASYLANKENDIPLF